LPPIDQVEPSAPPRDAINGAGIPVYPSTGM
jgi:hypothetical protein